MAAEANHYRSKYRAMVDLEKKGGEKTPDVAKMQRNKEKQDGAVGLRAPHSKIHTAC